jgi:hypothetical protein
MTPDDLRPVRARIAKQLEDLDVLRRALPEDDPQREEALTLSFRLTELLDDLDRMQAIQGILHQRGVPRRPEAS